MHHVILTAIGTDRPGLVDEVSQFIFQHGGNIEDSRMVNLHGQFAMMLLVGGGEAIQSQLHDDLPRFIRSTGLQIQLHVASPPRPTASAQALPYRLTATAMDQGGLVHRIAHLLRQHNANIENLDTHLTAAPITGAPVFEMDLTMSIPKETSLAKLRQSLGTLCDELNIDWDLSAL